MSEQQNNGDWLNIFSILLALQNLQENREQTKQNDVQAANDKQAKILLDEIGAKFSEQNEVISRILDKVFIIKNKIEKIEEKLNG